MRQENPFDPVDLEIVERWKATLDVAERSKDAYELGFKAFCAFVRDCGLDFDRLEAGDVLAFKDYLLNDLKRSPATVSNYLAGVRSFYRFSEANGLENIAKNVKSVPVSHDFKKDALTPEQARRLLSAVKGDTLAARRDFAMLNLMLRTGLRDKEVVAADIGDVRSDSGARVLRVKGKGRSAKDEIVVLTREAAEPIEAYLAERGERDGGAPLFASVSKRNAGGRLTTRSVSRIAKGALRSIGLDDGRHTAHSLRHTAITFALLGGATEREAQEMARHADIGTTMVYSHHIDRIRSAGEPRTGNVLGEAQGRAHHASHYSYGCNELFCGLLHIDLS